MRKKHAFTTSLLLALLLNFGCAEKVPLVVKNAPKDPFKESMAPSQFFEISSKKDTVIEGNNGTLLVFQKGGFLDSNGTPVEDNIDIELAEALTLDEMLMSNLTTTSNDQLLETDGMIYFNATRDGEQLLVNPEKPVRIEIPTKQRKPGMQVYKGIRDENGNMDWVNPKPLNNYLIPIDINALDFLPRGFEEAVEKGMPFRNYKKATPALIDSLYYSLSFSLEETIIERAMPDLDINETFYDTSSESQLDVRVESELDSINDFDREQFYRPYGVDPAIIKTIKTEKFQNTIISTREFEKRLQIMFRICRTDIIDIYVNNLDKNLWELDSIAATILDDHIHQKRFISFSNEKHNNIKGYDKNGQLLKKFYEQRLKKVKDRLTQLKSEAIKAQNKKTKAAQKTIDAYKILLGKREKYRMETYGFEMTVTGWINIDRGVEPKNWEYQGLEITVENGQNFERVHSYVIYTSMKSLYRLNSKDKMKFHVGNENRREMIMPKNENAVAIAVAFNEEKPFLALKEFKTNTIKSFNLRPKRSSKREISKALAQFEGYSPENRIAKDLEFLKELNKERLRQEDLKKEWVFLAKLSGVAFPMDSTAMMYDKTYGIELLTCAARSRDSL